MTHFLSKYGFMQGSNDQQVGRSRTSTVETHQLHQEWVAVACQVVVQCRCRCFHCPLPVQRSAPQYRCHSRYWRSIDFLSLLSSQLPASSAAIGDCCALVPPNSDLLSSLYLVDVGLQMIRALRVSDCLVETPTPMDMHGVTSDRGLHVSCKQLLPTFEHGLETAAIA
jgi:hypothetical protein